MELARLDDSNRAKVYLRLQNGINKGLLYKECKRYYLTASGRVIYDSLCFEFESTYHELIKIITEEVKRNL